MSATLEAGDAESNAKARRITRGLLLEPRASTVIAVIRIKSVPTP